jgi:hypothetical protein
MVQYLKSLFRQLTPLEVITQELAIAHLEKLQGESGVDYAQSVVDYNAAKIKRLDAHLAAYSAEGGAA